MEQLKVLVVDSRVVSKKILSQAVEKTGLAQVTHTAPNGALALERLQQCSVDIVLLGLSLTDMSMIEIMEIITSRYPTIAVIMSGNQLTGATSNETLLNSEKNIENIKNQLQGLFTQIVTKKYTVHDVAVPIPTGAKPVNLQQKKVHRSRLSEVDLVVMASSTGGTKALETICRELPAGFLKPILVVQHMPAEMTKKFAQSLSKKCRLPVVEAQEGNPVKPGQVMIAPGGVHMTVQPFNVSSAVINLETTPLVNGVRPAADVLFRSVANTYRGKRILAIILTGMGSDGTLGVEEMKKRCDCFCVTQSEKTCVVYGMPKSVVDAGLSDAVEDLQTIAARVLHYAAGWRS